jgi:bifunctional N-acetylglucosamine-1-phosphate-uridyltransferase/glucosamine-1-phosphate-acetyltransferase GlmU-like protein
MGSSLPKPLVSLAGRPLIAHLLDALDAAAGFLADSSLDVRVVVGHGEELVRSTLGSRCHYVRQDEPRGTGHAALQAMPYFPDYDHVLVFVGDSALIRPPTIVGLVEQHLDRGADCTFLTGEFPTERPYARVLRDPGGRLRGCVDSADASPEERKITEYVTSQYAFRAEPLLAHLPRIRPAGKNAEMRLTDIINIMLAARCAVEAQRVSDYRELVGLNTPEDLAWAEGVRAEIG